MVHIRIGVKDGHAVSNLRSLRQNLPEPQTTGDALYVVCNNADRHSKRKCAMLQTITTITQSIVPMRATLERANKALGGRDTNRDITRAKNRHR